MQCILAISAKVDIHRTLKPVDDPKYLDNIGRRQTPSVRNWLLGLK